MNYDLIIIGAGAAGISSAIYAVSRGLDVLVLEKNEVGGLIGKVSTVTHYTSVIPQETGATFSARMKQQALDSGVNIQYETVTSVKLDADLKEITTEKGTYTAKAVILANGTTPKQLDIPGAAQFTGTSFALNAPKHGELHQGKSMYVIGGADGAVKEALYLAQFAKQVTIVCVEEQLACIKEFQKKITSHDNIIVKPHASLTGMFGEDSIEFLEFTDLLSGENEIIEDKDCAIFVYAGSIPNTQIYPELDLVGGFIPTTDGETALSGVYAAGDICVKQIRQVATAVSDGAVAGIKAAAYIMSK